ncbi:4692_t:CDS:10 [Paraglomus occultum]|uniref:Phosphodiesterase n=1 Tax=Paraglomus occultum TaxID=144539 RepID=A0A9N9F9I9_9GLOM|nr:4692_t:CDS:10 [Paraglomus occultum]
MEPSRCSIIIVDRSLPERSYLAHQNIPEPYITNGIVNGKDDCTKDLDIFKVLSGLFAEVTSVKSGTEALTRLRKRPRLGGIPTIIIIDIDHEDNREYIRRESYVLDVTNGVPMKPLSNGSVLYGTSLLKCVNDEIRKGSLDQVIPIVCSWGDSFESMTNCLNMGAVDYLIKPVRPEVAKTLFLNIYRADSMVKTSGTGMALECKRPIMRRSKNWDCLKTRLHAVFVEDKWLTEALFEYYSPPDSVLATSYFPSLDSAAALERMNYLKKQISEWEFPPPDLTDEDLLRCAVIMFEHVLSMDELSHLDVSTEQLHRFLLAIRQSYHDSNPYHNFCHAVDVLQAMFHFLCKMGLIPPIFTSNKRFSNRSVNQQSRRVSDLLRPADIFALLLASIGHDIGHPGVNNKFLVDARTPLAQLYNDRSVLESFHAMALFNLMDKYKFHIFQDEDKSGNDYAEFRKIVLNAILATDMGLHNEYVTKIKNLTSRFTQTGFVTSSPESLEQERIIIVGALIKCADISNTARPYHIAEGWATVLLEEFGCQGDLEKLLGLPVGPTNDRENVSQPGSQLSFIEAFAMPLFSCVSELIPEMSYYIRFLSQNLNTWRRKKQEENEGRSTRQNSELDSSVTVSLDSRQNSPIVPIPVPAAKTLERDSSMTIIRPIPSEGLVSEALSEDAKSTTRDDLVSTGASDFPLTSRHRKKKRLGWNPFKKIKWMSHSGANNNAMDDSNSQTINSTVSSDKRAGTGCCCVQ